MIRTPTVLNLVILLATLVFMFGAIIGLRRWISSKQAARKRRPLDRPSSPAQPPRDLAA
jgi:hypothetical protein